MNSSLTRSSRAALLAFAAALLPLAGSEQLAAQGTAPYHQIATYTLGGDGGWDYLTLDTASHRLFVARNDRVMVIDEKTGKLLGEITGLHRTHGIAFDYGAKHGFVTASGDSSVTMFDLATLEVLGTEKAAAGANALIFDQGSGSRVLVQRRRQQRERDRRAHGEEHRNDPARRTPRVRGVGWHGQGVRESREL